MFLDMLLTTIFDIIFIYLMTITWIDYMYYIMFYQCHACICLLYVYHISTIYLLYIYYISTIDLVYISNYYIPTICTICILYVYYIHQFCILCLLSLQCRVPQTLYLLDTYHWIGKPTKLQILWGNIVFTRYLIKNIVFF